MALDFNDISNDLMEEYDNIPGQKVLENLENVITETAKQLSSVYSSLFPDTRHDDLFYIKDTRLRFYTSTKPHWSSLKFLDFWGREDVHKAVTTYDLWIDGAAIDRNTFWFEPTKTKEIWTVDEQVYDISQYEMVKLDIQLITRFMEVLQRFKQEKHYRTGSPIQQIFDLSHSSVLVIENMSTEIPKFLEFCARYENQPQFPVYFSTTFTGRLIQCCFSELEDQQYAIAELHKRVLDSLDFNLITPNVVGKFIRDITNEIKTSDNGIRL